MLRSQITSESSFHSVTRTCGFCWQRYLLTPWQGVVSGSWKEADGSRDAFIGSVALAGRSRSRPPMTMPITRHGTLVRLHLYRLAHQATTSFKMHL